jgi:hypothetical protein
MGRPSVPVQPMIYRPERDSYQSKPVRPAVELPGGERQLPLCSASAWVQALAPAPSVPDFALPVRQQTAQPLYRFSARVTPILPGSAAQSAPFRARRWALAPEAPATPQQAPLRSMPLLFQGPQPAAR